MSWTNCTFPFRSSCGNCVIDSYHWCCFFCHASLHGSVPIPPGNGAFLGADAMDGFLGAGAGFTEMVDAALEDAGCCGWTEGAAMDI